MPGVIHSVPMHSTSVSQAYVAHSVPTAFILNAVGTEWVTPGLPRMVLLGSFHTFLSSADLFQNQLFRKILSGIPSEWQTVLIQIRPDILSGMIWIQIVCKGHQSTALECKEVTLYPYRQNPSNFVY